MPLVNSIDVIIAPIDKTNGDLPYHILNKLDPPIEVRRPEQAAVIAKSALTMHLVALIQQSSSILSHLGVYTGENGNDTVGTRAQNAANELYAQGRVSHTATIAES